MSKPHYFFKNVAGDESEDDVFWTIWDLQASWIFQNDWMLIFFITFLGIIFEVILINIYAFLKKKPVLPGKSGSDSQKNEDICLESTAFAPKNPSVIHPTSKERNDIFSESTTSTLISEENESHFEDHILSSDEKLCSGTSERDYQVNCVCKSRMPFPGDASSSLSLFNSEVKEKIQNHREYSENEYEQNHFSSKTLFSIMKTNKNKKPEFSSDLSLSKTSKSSIENEDLNVAPFPPAHLVLSRHQVRLLEENVRHRISLKPKCILQTKHHRSQENFEHSLEIESRNSFPEQHAIQNQGFYDARFASQAQQFIYNQESVNDQPNNPVNYFHQPQDLPVKPFSNSIQGCFQTQDMNRSQHSIKVPCIIEIRDLLKGGEANEYFGDAQNSACFKDSNKIKCPIKEQNTGFQNAEFSALSRKSVAKDMPQLKKKMPKGQGKLASSELSQYSVYSAMPCMPTVKEQKNRKKSSYNKCKLSVKVPSLKAKKTPTSWVSQIIMCHTSKNKNELGWKHNTEKEELHLLSVSKLIIPYIEKHSRKNLVKVLPDVIKCDYFVKKQNKSPDVEKTSYMGMSDIIENLKQYGRENTALQNTSSKVLPQFGHSFMINADKLKAPYFLLEEINKKSKKLPEVPIEQAFHLDILKHEIPSEEAMSESRQKFTSSLKMRTNGEIKMKEDLQSAENGEELPASTPNLQGDFPKENAQKREDLLKIVLEFSDVNLLISLRPQNHKNSEELQGIKVQANTECVNPKKSIPLSPNITTQNGNLTEHEELEFNTRSSIKNMHHTNSTSDAFYDTIYATISQTPDTEMHSRSSDRMGTSTVRLSNSVLKQDELEHEKETEKEKCIDESPIVKEPQDCDREEEKQRAVPPLSQDLRFSIDKKKNSKCVRFNMEPISLGSKSIQDKKQQVYPQIPSTQTASRAVPSPITDQLQVEKMKQNPSRPTSRENAIDPVCPLMPENLSTGKYLIETRDNWVPSGENLRKKLDSRMAQEKEDLERDLSSVAIECFETRKKWSRTKNSLIRQVIRKVKKPAISQMLYLNRRDTSSHRRKLRNNVEIIIKQMLQDKSLSDALLNAYPHVSILSDTGMHTRLNAENYCYIELTKGKPQLDSEGKHLCSFCEENTSPNTLEARLQDEVKLVEEAQPKLAPRDSWIFRYDLATKMKDIYQSKEATDKMCSLTDINTISQTETEKGIPRETRFMSTQGKQEGNITSDDVQESNFQDEEEREQEVLLKVIPQSSQHLEFCSGTGRDLNLYEPKSQVSRKILYVLEQPADLVQGEELRKSIQAQNDTIGTVIAKLPPLKSEESLTDAILVGTTYDALPNENHLAGVLHNWNGEEKVEFRSDLQTTILGSMNLFKSDLPDSTRQRKTFTCKALKSKSPTCITMKVKKPSISKIFNIPQCGYRKYLPPKTLKSQIVEFLTCSRILSDGFYIIVLEAEKQKGLAQELPAVSESLTFSPHTSPAPKIERGILALTDKRPKMSSNCVALKAKKVPISQMFNIIGCSTPSYRRPLKCSSKTKIKQGKLVGDLFLNAISSATPQAETVEKDPHSKEELSSVASLKTLFPKAEESEIGLILCDASWDGNLGRKWDSTISEKKSQNQKDLTALKPLSFSSLVSAESKSESYTFERVHKKCRRPRHKMLGAKQQRYPTGGHRKKKQHKIKYQEGENQWYAGVRESLFSAMEYSRSPSSKLMMDKRSFDPTTKRDTLPKKTVSNRTTVEKEKVQEHIAPSCLRSIDFFISVLSNSKSKGNTRQVLKNEIIVTLKCLTGKEKKPSVSQILKTNGHFIIKHKKKFQLNLRSKIKAMGQIKNVTDTFLNTTDFMSDFSDMTRQNQLKPEIAMRHSRHSYPQFSQAASPVEGQAEYSDSTNKGDTFHPLKEVKLHNGESGGEKQKPFIETGPSHTSNLTVNVQLIKESEPDKSEDMMLGEPFFSESQICEMNPEISVKLENNKNVQVTVKVGLSKVEKSRVWAKHSEPTNDAASRKYDKKKMDNSVLKEKFPYHLAGIVDSVDKQLSASQEIKNLADNLKIPEMSSAKVIPSQVQQPTLLWSHNTVNHSTVTINKKQNSKARSIKVEKNKADVNANVISTPASMPTLQNMKIDQSLSILDTYERPSKTRNAITKAKVGEKKAYKNQVMFNRTLQNSQPFEFRVVQTRNSEAPLVNRVFPKNIPSQKTDINLMGQNTELKVGEQFIPETVLFSEIHPIQNEKQNEFKTNPKNLVPHKKQQESYILPEAIWSSTCAYITMHPKIIISKDKEKTDDVKNPLPIRQKKRKAKKRPVSQWLGFGTGSNKKGRRVSTQQPKAVLLSKNVANLVLEGHFDSGCLMSQYKTLAEMKMKQDKLKEGENILLHLKMDKLLNEGPTSSSGCVNVSRIIEKLEENVGHQDILADILQCCIQPLQTGSRQSKALHRNRLDLQRKVHSEPVSQKDGASHILGSISSPLLGRTHTGKPKEEVKGKSIHQDAKFFSLQVNEASYSSSIQHMPQNIETLLLHIKKREKRKKSIRKYKRLETTMGLKITGNPDAEQFISKYKNNGILKQKDRPELDMSVGTLWTGQKPCPVDSTCHHDTGRAAVRSGPLYPQKTKMKVRKLPVFQMLYVTGYGTRSNKKEPRGNIKEEKDESQQGKTVTDFLLNDVCNCGQLSCQVTVVTEVKGEKDTPQKTAQVVPQLNLKTSLSEKKRSSTQIIDTSARPGTLRKLEQYDSDQKELQVISLDIVPRCRDYIMISPQIEKPFHMKSKVDLERDIVYSGIFPKKMEINGKICDTSRIRTNAELTREPLHLENIGEVPKEGEMYISKKNISNLLGREGLNDTCLFLNSKDQKSLGDLHGTCPDWREHAKPASNPKSVLDSVPCSTRSPLHLKQTPNMTRERRDNISINVNVNPCSEEQSVLTAIPINSKRWKMDFSEKPRVKQLDICNQTKEKILESIFSCVFHQFHTTNPKTQVPAEVMLNSSALEKASNEASIPADPSPCTRGINAHIRGRKEHQESTSEALPTWASSSLIDTYQIASSQLTKSLKPTSSRQYTLNTGKKKQKEKHRNDHLPKPISHSKTDLLQMTHDYSTPQTRIPLRKMDAIDEYTQQRKNRQNQYHLPISYESIKENTSCSENYPCHWPHLMPWLKGVLSEEGPVSSRKKGLDLCFKNQTSTECFVPPMARQMNRQNAMLPLEACGKTIKYWNPLFSKGNQSSDKPQVIETILNSNSPKIRVTKKGDLHKAKEKQIEAYVPSILLHFLSICIHLWHENNRQNGGLKEGVMKGIQWPESRALKSVFSDTFGATDCDIPSDGLEMQWNVKDKTITIKERLGDQDWIVTKIGEPIPSLPDFKSDKESTDVIISNRIKRKKQEEDGAKAVEMKGIRDSGIISKTEKSSLSHVIGGNELPLLFNIVKQEKKVQLGEGKLDVKLTNTCTFLPSPCHANLNSTIKERQNKSKIVRHDLPPLMSQTSSKVREVSFSESANQNNVKNVIEVKCLPQRKKKCKENIVNVKDIMDLVCKTLTRKESPFKHLLHGKEPRLNYKKQHKIVQENKNIPSTVQNKLRDCIPSSPRLEWDTKINENYKQGITRFHPPSSTLQGLSGTIRTRKEPTDTILSSMKRAKCLPQKDRVKIAPKEIIQSERIAVEKKQSSVVYKLQLNTEKEEKRMQDDEQGESLREFSISLPLYSEVNTKVKGEEAMQMKAKSCLLQPKLQGSSARDEITCTLSASSPIANSVIDAMEKIIYKEREDVKVEEVVPLKKMESSRLQEIQQDKKDQEKQQQNVVLTNSHDWIPSSHLKLILKIEKTNHETEAMKYSLPELTCKILSDEVRKASKKSTKGKITSTKNIKEYVLQKEEDKIKILAKRGIVYPKDKDLKGNKEQGKMDPQGKTQAKTDGEGIQEKKRDGEDQEEMEGEGREQGKMDLQGQEQEKINGEDKEQEEWNQEDKDQGKVNPESKKGQKQTDPEGKPQGKADAEGQGSGKRGPGGENTEVVMHAHFHLAPSQMDCELDTSMKGGEDVQGILGCAIPRLHHQKLCGAGKVAPAMSIGYGKSNDTSTTQEHQPQKGKMVRIKHGRHSAGTISKANQFPLPHVPLIARHGGRPPSKKTNVNENLGRVPKRKSKRGEVLTLPSIPCSKPDKGNKAREDKRELTKSILPCTRNIESLSLEKLKYIVSPFIDTLGNSKRTENPIEKIQGEMDPGIIKSCLSHLVLQKLLPARQTASTKTIARQKRNEKASLPLEEDKVQTLARNDLIPPDGTLSQKNTSTSPFMSLISQYSILSKRKEPPRSSKERGQMQEETRASNVGLNKTDSSLSCPLQVKLPGSSCEEVSYADVKESIGSQSLRVKVNPQRLCEEAKDRLETEGTKCGIVCQRTTLRVKIPPSAHIFHRKIVPLSIKEQRKEVQETNSKPRMVLKKSSSLPSLSCFKWDTNVNERECLRERTQFSFPSLTIQDAESMDALDGNRKELLQPVTQEEEKETLQIDVKDLLDPTIRKLLYSHMLRTEELQRKIKEQKRKMQEHKNALISILEDRMKTSSFTQFQSKKSSDRVRIACPETINDGDLANDLQEKNREKVARTNSVAVTTDMDLKTKKSPILKTCNFSSLQGQTKEQERKTQEGKREQNLTLTKISTAGCYLPLLSMCAGAGMEEKRRVMSTSSSLSTAKDLKPTGHDDNMYLKPVTGDVLINLQCRKQHMLQNKEEDEGQIGDIPVSPKFQEMKGQKCKDEPRVGLTKPATSLLCLPQLQLQKNIELGDGMLRLTRSLLRILETGEATLWETTGGDSMKEVANQHMFQKGKTDRKETIKKRCPDIIMKGKKSLPSYKLHRTELHIDIKGHKGKEQEEQDEPQALILRKNQPSKSSLPNLKRDESLQVDEEKIGSKMSLLPLIVKAFSNVEKIADTEPVYGDARKGKPYRTPKEGGFEMTTTDMTIRVHCKGPASSPIPHILNTKGFALNMKVREKKVHNHKGEPPVILSKTFLYTPSACLCTLESGDKIDKDVSGISGACFPQLHLQESSDIMETANRELIDGDNKNIKKSAQKEREKQCISDFMVDAQQRSEPSKVRSEKDEKMYFTGFGTIRHRKLLELHLMAQQENEPEKYKKEHVAAFNSYPATGNLKRQIDDSNHSSQKRSGKVPLSLPRQTAKQMCVTFGTPVILKGFSVAEGETHQQETVSKVSPESVDSLKLYNPKKDGQGSDKIIKMFSPRKLGSLEKMNTTKLIAPQKLEKKDTIMEKQIMLHSKSGHKTRSNSPLSVKFPSRDRKQEATLEIDVDRKTTLYTSLPILPGVHMQITEFNALRRKEDLTLLGPEQGARVLEFLQKSLKPLWTCLLQSGHVEEIKKETNKITSVNLEQQKQIETQVITHTENNCPGQQTQEKAQELSGIKQNLQLQESLQRNVVDSFCASIPLSLKRQKIRPTSLKTEPRPSKKTASFGFTRHSTPINKIEYTFKRTQNTILWNKNSPRIVIRNLSISMRPPHTKELETNLGSEQRLCLSKFKEKSANTSKIKRETFTVVKEKLNTTNTVPQYSQPFVVNEPQTQPLQVKAEANLKRERSQNKLIPSTGEKIAPGQGDRIIKKLNLHIIEQEDKIPKCILMHTECPFTFEDPLLPQERDPGGPRCDSTRDIQRQEAIPGTVPRIQNDEVKTLADGAGAERSFPICEAIKTPCDSHVRTRIQDKVSSDRLGKLQDYEPADTTSLPSPESSPAWPTILDSKPKAILQYFTPEEKNKLANYLDSKVLEIKCNLMPERAKASFRKFSLYSKGDILEDNSWKLDLRQKNLNFRSPERVEAVELNLEENYPKDYPLHSCVETPIARAKCDDRQPIPMPRTIPQPDSGTSSKVSARDPSGTHVLQSYSAKQRDKLLMHLSMKTLEIQMKALSRIVRESCAMANAQDRKNPSPSSCLHSAVKAPKRKNRILLLFEEKSLHQIDLDLQYKYLRFHLGLSVESTFRKPNALPQRPLNMPTISPGKQVDESRERGALSSDPPRLEPQIPLDKTSLKENPLLFTKAPEPVKACALPTRLREVLQKDTRAPSQLRPCMTPEKEKRYSVRFQEPNTQKPLHVRTQANASGFEDSHSAQISNDFSHQISTKSSATLGKCPTSEGSEDEECTILAGVLPKASQNIIFELQKDIPLGDLCKRKEAAYLKPLYSKVSGDSHKTASRKHTLIMSPPPVGSHKSGKYRASSKHPDSLCRNSPNAVEVHSVPSVSRNEEKPPWTALSTANPSSTSSSESYIPLHPGKKHHMHPESKGRKKTTFDVFRKHSAPHQPPSIEKQVRRKEVHDYESERLTSSQSKDGPATKLHHRDINFSSEKLQQPFFYACMPADTLEVVPQTVRWTIPSRTLRKRNFKVPLVAKITNSWKMWGSPR
ncbi:coiled-coil domain-containing protein 168 [Dipodomys spectabilis]|uniref:coiled-coil domain-containing protein 168 n=1 Tax=Dipodomys spectabilis TaxID=105255 RepID=UPI001C536CBB|nr:coiled-coil domain-containing protein 168 [Dipodomys spectabilis]